MPSERQIEVVRSMFEAVAAHDVERARQLATEDFHMSTSAFITGQREFHGHEGLDEWFALRREIESRGEKVALHPYRYLGDGADPDVVLAMTRVHISRPRGDDISTEAGYLMRLSGDLVERIHGFMDGTGAVAELREPYELR